MGLRVPLDLTHFSPLGAVGRAQRTARGLELAVGTELFRVDVVRPDVLRLAVSRARAFEERPTFATAFTPPAGVAWELEEHADSLVLRTSALRLELSRGELYYDVTRADGSLVLGTARDAGGDSLAYRTLNDSFA